MTTRFTKAVRQEIVREFALRHNGQYNPAVFLKEVRNTGKSHPAYSWFEWKVDKAAHEHNLWQAREFARDLRVSFKIEQVGRQTPVTVRQTEMPMVISPVDGRKKGGGYVLVDPEDAEHVAEHCRQAAAALRSWLDRYEAAILHAGMSRAEIDGIVAKLEQASVPKAA